VRRRIYPSLPGEIAGRSGPGSEINRQESQFARIPNSPFGPGACINAYLTAAQVQFFFDATGLGKPGKGWAGWAICNGNNGTPDDNGKFTRANTSAAGATGGSDSSAHTHPNDHDHASFNSGSTTLTDAQVPATEIGVGAIDVRMDTAAGAVCRNLAYTAGAASPSGNAISVQGGGQGHLHAVDVPAYTGDTGAASATDNRPAYAEKVPLMRIS
jgi:hypothetical protein